MTQPELGVDEVEVVVQAAAAVGLDERLVRALVVPRLERRAALHGAEDVDEPGLRAPLGDDLLDPVLLAERLDVADELDREAVLVGHTLGVLTDRLTQ